VSQNLEVKAIGAQKVVAKLSSLSVEIRARGKAAITRFSYALREAARKKYDDSGLHVRSGALKGSIATLPVKETKHQIVGGIVAGQKLKYAKAQEFGATIVPKKAQMLAIPLDAAKTAAGVARFAPRDAPAAGYTSTFIRNGVLFGKTGDQVVPLFRLVHSVKIPARPFMRPALRELRPQIEAGLREAVASAAAA
jgi:phage gpG-like protein